MTDKEKAIVMAHTGICMLTGDKFQIFHKYVEDIMGRPIMTHEFGWLADMIKEKSKADFIALCAEQEPCEDAVSRQAVLNTLDKRFDSIPVGQTTEILLLRKDLRELPSVTLYKVESEK